MTDKPEIIDWVAKLAYIEVGDVEKAKMAERLTKVLAYVDELQQVDTSQVTETMQITGLHNVMVDDVIAASPVSRETLLAQAPQSDRGMVRVPRVVDKRTTE